MADDDKEKLNTAITTWSGFVYQGKVAIYHVLKLLNASLDYSDHILRLEYFDDFDIINGSGNIVSIHQVKAWKVDTYGSFEGSIQKLLNKTVSNANDVERYFHVAKEIRGKSKEDIETENAPVKIYMYEGDPYCPVGGSDGIDNKIQSELTLWFRNSCTVPTFKHLDDYAILARQFLDQIVLKRILETHQVIHDDETTELEAACNKTISFAEFLNILRDENLNERLDDEYYFHVLLNDFHSYCQEFCIEKEDELSDDEKKKISCCMKEIENLTHTAIARFIRNIMPHRKFKFNSLRDYKNNAFDEREIKRAFLNILRNLKQPDFDLKYFFQWCTVDNFYSPTTIIDGQSHSTDICVDIIKNALDTDIDVLFESNSLITTDIEVPSITDEVPNIMKTHDINPDHINNWKTVALVKLSSVKEVIND